jgi:hypothetical protein
MVRRAREWVTARLQTAAHPRRWTPLGWLAAVQVVVLVTASLLLPIEWFWRLLFLVCVGRIAFDLWSHRLDASPPGGPTEDGAGGAARRLDRGAGASRRP